MKSILLIKTGSTMPEVRSDYGDFQVWFSAVMEVPRLVQVDVYRQRPLPTLTEVRQQLAGIVITGSAAMVSARPDWSEYTAAWLKMVIPTGVPILGVCYGHQLLAHALGGRVGPNPKGRQIGTVSAQLLAAAATDQLLGFLPRSFPAQTSHSECVLELPPHARRLAVSPKDNNFAIRFAQNTWGVQFHPEFSARVMDRYIQLRAKDLQREGQDPEQLQKNTTTTLQAKEVLVRFAALARQ